MSWRRQVLVVANLTAASDELFEALRARAARAPTRFTVIVPAGLGNGPARERLAELLSRMRSAGLEVDGALASSDPIVAVDEAWDPRRYDEIVVCTLPIPVSRWLHAGLPQRIAGLTGALVTHVTAHPPPPPSPATSAERRPQSNLGPLLGALSVLGWGGHANEPHGHWPE